jgi:hypothetical protein
VHEASELGEEFTVNEGKGNWKENAVIQISDRRICRV